MEEHKLRVFNAIASFVQDLNAAFGKKYKSVALYDRLVSHTTIRDVSAVERHVTAFGAFFSANPKYISDSILGNNTKISYNDRIFLDLGVILDKTDTDAHKHIHDHLTTIYSLMNIGTDAGRKALESLKNTGAGTNSELSLPNLPNTAEGNFIADSLSEMTQQLENLSGDSADPMTLMTQLMQTGFFTKFMGDLQSKFNSGELDIHSLMGTVSNVIGSTMPAGGEDAAQIQNFMTQSMGQIAALSGDAVAPEMQDHMSALLNAFGGASTNTL